MAQRHLYVAVKRVMELPEKKGFGKKQKKNIIEVARKMYPLFRISFAMTVHMAQGQTIPHTFICDDIIGSPFARRNYLAAFRLFYTAVSRVSEKLYIHECEHS